MSLTIVIDVDDVVCNLLSEWLRWYNIDYEDNLKPEQITEWDISKFTKCGVKIYDYLYKPLLYSNVKPIDGAVEGIKYLREKGHRVVFVTATPRQTSFVKLDWLNNNHIPTLQTDYIETNSKYFIRGDILLDDRPENVEGFLGTGVLFRRHHNKYYNWNPSVRNWKEFLNFVEAY